MAEDSKLTRVPPIKNTSTTPTAIPATPDKIVFPRKAITFGFGNKSSEFLSVKIHRIFYGRLVNFRPVKARTATTTTITITVSTTIKMVVWELGNSHSPT